MLARKNYLWCFFCLINILYIYLFPINCFIFNSWPLSVNQVQNESSYFLYIVLILPAIFIGAYLADKFILKIKDSKLSYVNNNRFTILVLVLIIGFIYIELFSGLNNGLYFNRLNRELLFFNSQLWVVFSILVVSTIFIFIYYFSQLNSNNKILGICIALSYFYLEIFQLGARRYSMQIILFYGAVYITRKNIQFTSIKNIFAIFILVILAIFFGQFREVIFHNRDIAAYEFIMNAISTNEFTAIGNGLYSAISTKINDEDFLFGTSYIKSPLLFIPRVFWENKPISLAHHYGVAVSFPLELYVNFFIYGSLIYGICSGAIFLIGKYYKSTLIYCAILAYIIDMIRGDFFGILYFSLILFIVYKTLIKK